MIGDIIKEYLVGLGVKIDKPGFSEFESTVNKTSNTISSATGAWVKNFAQASAIIATAIASVNASVAGLMVSSAKQDLAMEKYARNMMVSKKAAWEMKTAVDALGESLQDIYVTPELREQYKLLVGDARRMIPGAGFEGHAKEMRSVIFEFKRLKQEAGYSLNWVGYHLMRSLFGPLKNVRGTMKGLNEYIIKNMPELTAKISRGLLYIVDMGRRLWYAVRDITKALKSMWDSFPIGAKIAIAALTGIVMFLNASPLKLWLLALTAIVVLIDDFYSHLEGKESLFGDFWDALIKGAREAKPLIHEFSEKIGSLLSAFTKLGTTVLKMVKDGLKGVFEEIDKQKAIPELAKAIKDISDGLTKIVEGFDDVLNDLQKVELAKRFWRTFKEGAADSVKHVSYLLSGLGHLGSMMGSIMSRDWDAVKLHSAKFESYMLLAGANFLSQNSKGLFGMSPPNDDKVKGIDNYMKETQGRDGQVNMCTRYVNEVYQKGAGLVSGEDIPASLWGPDQMEWYKKQGLLQTGLSQEEYIKFMRAGDQVYWDSDKAGDAGHVGIVGTDGKVYQWGSASGTAGLDPNVYPIIGVSRPKKLGGHAPNHEKPQPKSSPEAVSKELQARRDWWNKPMYKPIPDSGQSAESSFTGRLGKHVIDFAKSDYVKQIFSLGGGMGSWDFGNGSSTTVSVGDINVSVAGTNSSAQEIGQAVSSAIQNQSSRAQRLAHGRSLTSPVG